MSLLVVRECLDAVSDQSTASAFAESADSHVS